MSCGDDVHNKCTILALPLNSPLPTKLGQRQSHYTFIHTYACTFPLNLPQRTRKKLISIFSGHRGYAVSMLCLCVMFNQTYRKHYARTAQNSRFQAISEFCRQSGNNYIAIALQRVGQGCPLRTFPFATYRKRCPAAQPILTQSKLLDQWTWTKRTPKGSL